MNVRQLPPDLAFDGVMRYGDRQLLQFTELDKSSPSYGATFYLEAAGNLDALIVRRAEKRAQFARGAAKAA